MSYNTRMKNQKGFVAPIVIILVLAALGGSAYMYIKSDRGLDSTTATDTAVNSDISDWKTYKNYSFGFEMLIPANSELKAETNDSVNRLAYFTYDDGKSFEVRLEEIRAGEKLNDYMYRDSAAYGNTTLAGKPALMFKNSGYSDGGESFPPAIALATDHGRYFYRLEFHGDIEVSSVEQKMIDSFEFTSSNAARIPKTQIEKAGMDVLVALKGGDYQKLESLTSSNGLSWNENPNLDLAKSDIAKDRISDIPSDRNKYLFGYTDGRGDPITLTAADYVKEYIYNADYLNSDNVTQNETARGGNCLNTIAEDSGDRAYLAYHLGEPHSGFNWSTLYLVFDYENSAYKLRGMAKDHWCI